MSGQLNYPGTPRSRKWMNTRRVFGLGLAILLCVVAGYQIAPFKHPSQEFGSAGPGSAAPEDAHAQEIPKADDAELRQSEFCTNNCDSSKIYRQLWYDARMSENARNFQPSEAADDPYRDSIETNLVTKDFRVVIKVLAFNRLNSLRRCLQSLAKADYGGDRVNIQIFVDHFRFEETVRNGSEEEDAGVGRRLLRSLFQRAPVQAKREVVNGSDFVQEIVSRSKVEAPQSPRRDLEMRSVDEQLGEAHEILRFVDEFSWEHGTKEIHYRSQNAGLQAQWIESWWPADLDEFAFIVDDDMEVSNLYYRFLRTVVATYYYNPEQYDPSVYGVSLQRPRFVPGRGGLPLHVNSTKNLFLYPLVGTWGQLLFPKQWKEFRLWYDDHKSRGERPFLEGMVTNSWHKDLGERIWTPWFVKFAHTRGYFNFYTNFSEDRALSVSHREPGTDDKQAAGPDSELLKTIEAGNDTMLWVMSPSKSLPQFDFCFRGVKIWSVSRTPPELSPMLASMEVNNSVLLVNIIDVHGVLVRNWLCHMERLGVRKFVVLGDDEELISDLARRGYATVSSQLFPEAEALRRRDLIAVQAVHEVLNLGYSVWLTRADTVWVENPVDTGDNVNGSSSSSSDVMGSQPLDGFHPALLYIRASQGMLRVWSKWVGHMSVRNESISSPGSVWPGLQSFITSDTNCSYSALPGNVSGSFRDLRTAASGKKVFLFDGIQDRNVPFVVHTLKAAGLWAIDQDLACNRVYC